MSKNPMWCDCDHDDETPDHMAAEHATVMAARQALVAAMTVRMTPGRLPKVPNQPKTRAYAVRIDDERHRKLLEQAKVEGGNFSEMIRNAIDAYLENPPDGPREESTDEAEE